MVRPQEIKWAKSLFWGECRRTTLKVQVNKPARSKYISSRALQTHRNTHNDRHKQSTTQMHMGRHTNTNSVTHTDTHQISGATGSKATNSRNLIEAGRNQRMSWACQMLSLATEIATHTSEPMGHHYQIDVWLTHLRSLSLTLHPSLPLFPFSFIINETHDCSQLQCIGEP